MSENEIKSICIALLGHSAENLGTSIDLATRFSESMFKSFLVTRFVRFADLPLWIGKNFNMRCLAIAEKCFFYKSHYTKRKIDMSLKMSKSPF